MITRGDLVPLTRDGNMAAGDLLAGKIGYAKGKRFVGTMPNNAGDVACVSAHASGTALHVIPATGYTDGSDDASTVAGADVILGNVLTTSTDGVVTLASSVAEDNYVYPIGGYVHSGSDTDTSITYTGDAVPASSTPAWSEVGTADVESVSGGILTLRTAGTNVRYVVNFDNNITNADNAVVRLRFKKEAGGSITTDQGVHLTFQNGTKGYIINFSNDLAGSILYKNSGGTDTTLVTGQVYTDYADWELFVIGGVMRVFKNGVKVGADVAAASCVAGSPTDLYGGFYCYGDVHSLIDSATFQFNANQIIPPYAIGGTAANYLVANTGAIGTFGYIPSSLVGMKISASTLL